MILNLEVYCVLSPTNAKPSDCFSHLDVKKFDPRDETGALN